MNDFTVIYEWLKNGCTPLYDLWVVSSMLDDQKNVVQPNSSETMYEVYYEPYRDGGRKYIFQPREPYFFDVDIICYRAFYTDQNEYNLDTLDSVQKVCDWLIAQQNNGNVPRFETNQCYQMECLSAKPFIRNVFEQDGDPNAFLVDYAVTVRFYTENPAKRRVVIK